MSPDLTLAMAARKKIKVCSNPSILEYFKTSGTSSSGSMTETAESSQVTRQDGDDADADSEESMDDNDEPEPENDEPSSESSDDHETTTAKSKSKKKISIRLEPHQPKNQSFQQ